MFLLIRVTKLVIKLTIHNSRFIIFPRKTVFCLYYILLSVGLTKNIYLCTLREDTPACC